LVEKPSGVIDDVRALAAQGYHWCVVDTPPTDTDINEFAILVADLVIVPVRASFLDLNATQMITDSWKKRRKRYAFLVNAFDSRPAFKKANAEALELLDGQGPVFETRLPYSAKFM
jgi:cellulose biosynthesis protein BcsQ